MMTQRFALIIASALTAFVLVLMLGVGLTVGARSVVEAQAATPVTAIQVAEQLVVPAPAAVKPQLSADQAARIAMNLASNTQLTRTPELVNLQGALAYEVVLNQGIIYVDANSGKVLVNGVTASAKPTVKPTAAPTRKASEHSEVNQGGHDD
jgi:hypothetical protein